MPAGIAMHAGGWALAAIALAVAAVIGSCAAALRAGQPAVLRAAHATMAAAMVPMIVPVGRTGPPATLIVLAGMSAVLSRHVARPPAGTAGDPSRPLACLVDLIGMGAVLGLAAASGWGEPAVLVLAGGWAVTSLWLRSDDLARSARARAVPAEALTALVAAGAMALMAVAMNPG